MRLRFVVATVIPLAMSSSAQGQPTFSTVESIDWMVKNIGQRNNRDGRRPLTDAAEPQANVIRGRP
jgi:hypothetical protein